MSARTNGTADSGTAGGAGTSPWLVAVLVALAVFMEVLDTTIANVSLRYIAGDMGVSQDEASWLVTTYLIANAVALTASSFLARRFGRKAFFLACLGVFTASSVLCGLAWNLNSLLLFRLLQGLGGGGMVPVAQSILADAFPPEKRGRGFALFGVAVVVAPVIGPTLGGWLSDNLSWRWNFFVNGPVGILTMVMIAVIFREARTAGEKRRRARQKRVGFDLIGFVLGATFLGTLEIVLSRGLIKDWFSSSFIVTFAVICGLAFLLLIPWELSRRNPMIDVRMVATRQFGTCFVVMMATGVILYATTQFLPRLVQELYGYTATWAGFVLSPGGAVTMGVMLLVGPLADWVQPKYLVATGAAVAAYSMYYMTDLTPDLNFWFFAHSRIFLGVGLPLIFIPILTASYVGLPADKIDQASALMNVARNTSGSIGVSLAINVLVHGQQIHQNRLVGNVVPSDVQYRQTIEQVTRYFIDHGSPVLEARQQALAWIGQLVQTQASYLAYIDVFWTLTVTSLLAVPLALTLRKVKRGRAAPVHAARTRV